MTQLQFFATKSDMETLLGTLEDRISLKYVAFGDSDGLGAVTYERGSDLPRLGYARSESAGDHYLMVAKQESVVVRPVELRDGTKRYVVDQLANPKSVVLSPGGIWGDDVLLYGRFATVSEEREAQAIMRRASHALRKKFRRIRAAWVGPAAEICLDAGRRLTVSACASREFDLVRDEKVPR